MKPITILPVLLLACSSAPPPAAPNPTPPMPVDAAPADSTTAVAPAGPALPWLRGSTHVHARPSGDSTTEIASVIAWYEQHAYDFIVLTDHNLVTEVDADTTGKAAVRSPATGLIVLAGTELTFNPSVCLPQEPATKCRIHVNALGVTKRPVGKIEWADRTTDQRLDMYVRGLTWTTDLGGIGQLNHPQWQWGMTAELLTELGRRGYRLVEIANRGFEAWNGGDATHPSVEALWDAALTAGVELWGVATDDAHDYNEDGGGEYPAGTGWVMVKAARDPDAIKAALAAGEFYSSTGVTLARADAIGGELIVEVDATSPGAHTIAFISGGQVVEAVTARAARAAIPRGSYLRAVVRRTADGALAWVQPAR